MRRTKEGCNPVLVAAVRRYSNTQQRSISFSVFYMMMNVGFFISGCLFDFVRRGLGEHGHLTLPLLGTTLTTYRTLFLVSMVLELTLFPVIYLLREGAEVTDEGVRIKIEPLGFDELGGFPPAARKVDMRRVLVAGQLGAGQAPNQVGAVHEHRGDDAE